MRVAGGTQVAAPLLPASPVLVGASELLMCSRCVLMSHDFTFYIPVLVISSGKREIERLDSCLQKG